jgi:DNA-binding transcriptional MerR regulator
MTNVSRMSIGKVARICGLAPSAIRYYERAGLLPRPARVRRQRRYGPETIGRVRLRRMRALLESSFRCHCLSLEDCARFIGGDAG